MKCQALVKLHCKPLILPTMQYIRIAGYAGSHGVISWVDVRYLHVFKYVAVRSEGAVRVVAVVTQLIVIIRLAASARTSIMTHCNLLIGTLINPHKLSIQLQPTKLMNRLHEPRHIKTVSIILRSYG
ncbi:hypothetical protein M404DRAFT_238931 [Pisolithus tinctorius Marx 270]|uniref:Uncharacterized protein n=1 Tax=Pisolithus tinctorius Marx 270 TaxID=870435 RepID=A0A0C3IHT5_PISTI|nr:hypothetical protein M404DRAFT_238931 [Pisolithus tinctorius Marx 270]